MGPPVPLEREVSAGIKGKVIGAFQDGQLRIRGDLFRIILGDLDLLDLQGIGDADDAGAGSPDVRAHPDAGWIARRSLSITQGIWQQSISRQVRPLIYMEGRSRE